MENIGVAYQFGHNFAVGVREASGETLVWGVNGEVTTWNEARAARECVSYLCGF